jgi:hypothetical protein
VNSVGSQVAASFDLQELPLVTSGHIDPVG